MKMLSIGNRFYQGWPGHLHQTQKTKLHSSTSSSWHDGLVLNSKAEACQWCKAATMRLRNHCINYVNMSTSAECIVYTLTTQWQWRVKVSYMRWIKLLPPKPGFEHLRFGNSFLRRNPTKCCSANSVKLKWHIIAAQPLSVSISWKSWHPCIKLKLYIFVHIHNAIICVDESNMQLLFNFQCKFYILEKASTQVYGVLSCTHCMSRLLESSQTLNGEQWRQMLLEWIVGCITHQRMYQPMRLRQGSKC